MTSSEAFENYWTSYLNELSHIRPPLDTKTIDVLHDTVAAGWRARDMEVYALKMKLSDVIFAARQLSQILWHNEVNGSGLHIRGQLRDLDRLIYARDDKEKQNAETTKD